jgi:hypothetical protein
MSVQDNKELTRRLFADYNTIKGDVSKSNAWVDNSYSPGAITHAPMSGDMNLEQIKQYHAAQTVALNPLYTLKQIIAERDMVVAQFILTLTHKAPFMGVQPTGKNIQVDGNMMIKFSGNKMEEIWLYMDTLGLMRQLGAVPSPATAK